MNCMRCGAFLPEGTRFCPNCGAEALEEVMRPQYQQQQTFTEQNIPEQYRPLSPWAYWGLSILYAVPIVGFVFLIVFSFNSSNINRRNFTRAYWCGLLLAAIVVIILLVTGVTAGVASDIYYNL